MKTYSQKTADVSRKWYLIDAAEAPVGRISTVTASLLIGKGKPSVTAHVDGGDYVVIINADKLIMTGAKDEKKLYHRHSGFPGGLRTRQLKDVIKSDSTTVIFKAVRGMLPVNKLRDQRLARLKIYTGSEHSHTAQSPMPLPINRKGNA